MAALAAVALFGALAAAPAQRASAQAPCTSIADDAQRLACYDRALRGTPPAAPSAPAEAPARAAAPATAPAAVAEPRRAERQVRQSSVTAAPAAPAAPVAPSAGSADDGIVPLVIVGVRALPGRETTFTADDGTIWVQTDGQRVVGLPDTPFDAELKPGAMGSHFLVPKDRGRAVRVRQAR